MARDFTKIESTLFTLSAQFACDLANKEAKEVQHYLSPKWFDSFDRNFPIYYELLQRTAKNHFRQATQ